MTSTQYTAQLQAGLGMIEETRGLLQLWHAGMQPPELFQAALSSGRFPNVSARRLRNVVVECFAPRLLQDDGRPAKTMKVLMERVPAVQAEQLLFVYTCRANSILADFVREVYWGTYTGGREEIANEDAKAFVARANEDGRTNPRWSASTVRRVAGYLTGACADFGLLEPGRRIVRRIRAFRLDGKVAAVLAYDLHFSGLGDNNVIASRDWSLFGMDRTEVIAELKRLSLKGFVIVQAAGDVTRVAWRHKDLEELADALAES